MENRNKKGDDEVRKTCVINIFICLEIIFISLMF